MSTKNKQPKSPSKDSGKAKVIDSKAEEAFSSDETNFHLTDMDFPDSPGSLTEWVLDQRSLPDEKRVSRHEIGNEIQTIMMEEEDEGDVYLVDEKYDLSFSTSQVMDAYHLLFRDKKSADDLLTTGRDAEIDLDESTEKELARQVIEYARDEFYELGLIDNANILDRALYVEESVDSYSDSLNKLRMGVDDEKTVSPDHFLEGFGYNSENAEYGNIDFRGDLEDLEDVEISAGDWGGVPANTLYKNWVGHVHEDVEDPKMYVEADVGDDKVVFRYGDNGSGISEEDIHDLWEYNGSLGMALSKDLVEAAGGDIRYDEELGIDGGAGFRIEFERADYEEAPNPSHTASSDLRAAHTGD